MQRPYISSETGHLEETIIKIMGFWGRIRESVWLYLGFNKPLISYIPSSQKILKKKISKKQVV